MFVQEKIIEAIFDLLRCPLERANWQASGTGGRTAYLERLNDLGTDQAGPECWVRLVFQDTLYGHGEANWRRGHAGVLISYRHHIFGLNVPNLI